MEQPARFFDGLTAAQHEVVARFEPDAVTIRMADGTEHRWLAADMAHEPPAAPEGPVRLNVAGSDAVLIIAGSEVRAWLAAQGKRRRRGHPAQRRLTWIAGSVIVAIALFAVGWATIVPAALARLIPMSLEQSVGDGVVEQLTTIFSTVGGKRVALCTGRDGRAVLDRLVERLAAASRTTYPLQLVVVDSPVMNALTAPGGRIVVFDGLLRYVNGPDEFAGVLAHEIGHVIHRDPTTAFIRSAGLSTLIDLASGGASGGGGLSVAAQLLVTTSYGREAERAADEAALRILAAAGMNGRGLVSLFERLAKEKETDLQALRMVSTHPPSTERAERLRTGAGTGGRPAVTPGDWLVLRRICGEGKTYPTRRAAPARSRS